jgi:hypothetical protein
MKLDLDNLEASGRTVYEVIAGSRMYGTNVPESDVDLRGVFAFPSQETINIPKLKIPGEIKNDSEDIKYFELSKFIDLCCECNPNILELLWPPDDSVRVMTPLMRHIIANREMFVAKKAAMSFIGYARDQIGKAKGQNKMVNNPQSEKKPTKEDFCRVLNKHLMAGEKNLFDPENDIFPMRSVLIGETDIDLSEYHAASVEHAPYQYRLYYYGEAAKGVFRGDDMLVTESIPKEDEIDKFWGVLFYNPDAFTKALKQWTRYWAWIRNRNEDRWKGQDGENFQYDKKNMQHCMRTLMSGLSLITKGEPIVRFEGEDLAFLRSIRGSDVPYDELISKAEEMIVDIDEKTDKSGLRSRPDVAKANALYRELREMADDPAAMKNEKG